MSAQEANALVGVPSGVVLACVSCQEAWELTVDDFESGATGCPHCGGWTMIAQLAEPRRPA